MSRNLFQLVYRHKNSFCNSRSTFLNSFNQKQTFVNYRKIMQLSTVINVFEKHIPKYLAETWDNTGLLIEPDKALSISTIFLTNDLTEDVLEEALSARANLIISYHPPLFKPMKSFLCANWKDRIAMKCIAHNVAVYSPHTACDSVQGGVNDWLLKCFDLELQEPIVRSPDFLYCVLECLVPPEASILQTLQTQVDFKVILKKQSEDKLWLKVMFNKESKGKVLPFLSKYPEIDLLTIQDCLHPTQVALTGAGRIGKLRVPLTLEKCISKVKNYIGLDHLRVTFGMNKSLDSDISTIAVCAGSGTSVLSHTSADLFITGEMSHHDLLDVRHKGTSAILCEHSNSERGYLEFLKNQIGCDLPGVNLILSSVDKDPVHII